MSNLYYTSPTDVEAGTKARSIDINAIDSATDAAFDKLPTETNIKQGKVNYAVDTGAADAYVVSLPHAPASYADGLLVSFRPTNTNTGASTINVNGLGVKSIRNTAGSALSAGDITSGSPIDIRYSTATGFFHLAPNSTNSATAAAASATAAAASASSASSSASSSSASATTASNYATKTDGFASGSDNSSKSWAVGGTGDGQPSAGDAKSWATKTTGAVAASDYSAKEWAIGTQIRGVASAGSAKDWATYTGGTVDGTEYSAKYYSQQASATVASLAASTGSSLVGHIASGTGTVATTVQAKLRETVSVKDFGAVGDGVTSDQAAVAAAVAAAYSAGAILEWPAGTYLTTATIPNFHDILHVGKGVVKRGSDTWKISGNTGNNIIYVATTGNDANDGLSSSQPRLTFQSAFNALLNWSDALLRNGTFKVVAAAGTYTEGATLDGLQSKNMIIVEGPDVGGHPNVPTAIIDGTGATAEHGLYFFRGIKVHVKNIKVRDFTTASYSYGVVIDAGGYLQTTNVHTEGNQYAGISVDDGAVGRIGGGIHSNLYFGIRVHDNAMATVGYAGGAVSNRPQITNNPIGIGFLDGAQGHIDYCDISGGSVGIMLEDLARAHILGTTSTGCSSSDLECRTGSTWYDDPTTVNTFSSAIPYIHAHGVDYANRYGYIFDKANVRWKWGGSAWATPTNKFHLEHSSATSTFLSDAAGGRFILDSSTDNIFQFGSGGSGYQSGISHAKNGTANVGGLLYTYSDDTYRMRIASADAYRWGASRFQPMTDGDKDLGGPSNRWNDAYIKTLRATSVLTSDLNSVVTAQFDKTSSASYSNVPGLSATLAAGGTYKFRAVLSVTSGAGGISCALGGTATATSVAATGWVYNGATIVNSQKTTSATGAVGSFTGTTTDVIIEGAFVVNAAGTLTIRFAQNASNAATSSVLINSTLECIRIS
jgi:hypothetical protein